VLDGVEELLPPLADIGNRLRRVVSQREEPEAVVAQAPQGGAALPMSVNGTAL
jgi:hypothetical protein